MRIGAPCSRDEACREPPRLEPAGAASPSTSAAVRGGVRVRQRRAATVTVRHGVSRRPAGARVDHVVRGRRCAVRQRRTVVPDVARPPLAIATPGPAIVEGSRVIVGDADGPARRRRRARQRQRRLRGDEHARPVTVRRPTGRQRPPSSALAVAPRSSSSPRGTVSSSRSRSSSMSCQVARRGATGRSAHDPRVRDERERPVVAGRPQLGAERRVDEAVGRPRCPEAGLDELREEIRDADRCPGVRVCVPELRVASEAAAGRADALEEPVDGRAGGGERPRVRDGDDGGGAPDAKRRCPDHDPPDTTTGGE